MEKSQIVLLIIVGSVVLLLLVSIGFKRLLLGNSYRNNGEEKYSRSDMRKRMHGETEQLALENFDSIVVKGAWRITVVQGDSYSVSISHPKRRMAQVYREGTRLILSPRHKPHLLNGEFTAEISMPVLRALQVEGVTRASVKGFDLPSLTVQLEGAGEVRAEQSRVERLQVRLEGLGKIDLKDLKAVDAEVHLEGAGEIFLTMDGGVLEGSLDGLGAIHYSGNVRDERIKVDGLGQVRRD